MKLLVVFGTRPEAIKMAPLVKALQQSPKLEVKVCVTAQHRQMLDQVLQLFDITPDFDLNLMRPGQTLTQLTCNILQGMEGVLAQYKPNWVLVHGDTSTTLATGLAAYYQQVGVAHVEAGLRTHNLYSPWPEEANRQLTGRLAGLHFAPTVQAQTNLLNEGVDPASIQVTGNTVIDALLSVSQRLDQDGVLSEQLAAQFPYLDAAKRLVLVTGHRRENFGAGFEAMCQALKAVASHPSGAMCLGHCSTWQPAWPKPQQSSNLGWHTAYVSFYLDDRAGSRAGVGALADSDPRRLRRNASALSRISAYSWNGLGSSGQPS